MSKLMREECGKKWFSVGIFRMNMVMFASVLLLPDKLRPSYVIRFLVLQLSKIVILLLRYSVQYHSMELAYQ